MVALHISIIHHGGKRFEMKCDNLRREDATDPEIAMANLYEQALREIMHGIAEKIVNDEIKQTGPEAKNES